MKKVLAIIVITFIASCSDLEFVYKENKNLINPLYEKTYFSTSGYSINFINSYLPMFFGDKKEDTFKLSININQKKTKTSVKSNQAASMIRYELQFTYILISNEKDCVTFEKELLSYFSIIPKSSGYNYGTDASLEKKYELAIIENLDRFTSMLSDMSINTCK
tara:strand:- start:1949 stop:2437 length:489 start_codon:yes stop_codon:yes gene_type:complete